MTPDRYPAMEADGFAGLSDRGLSIDAGRLTRDLACWDPAMGEVNRDLIYAHHAARDHAIELVSVARGLDSRQSFDDGTAANELAHLVRREHQASGRYVGALAEAGRLRSQAQQREHEVAALSVQVAEANAQLSEVYAQLGDARTQFATLEGSLRLLRDTRRYRLACLIARPLDRLREHRHVARG